MHLPFLTARWRNLIVVNYEVPAEILEPLLPAGLELDLFEGKALVSIVAFYFTDNRFLGLLPTFPVSAFEEINLRFYVRREARGEIRRGVVFVKEIVPSHLIALAARLLYGEPYEAHPMSHSLEHFDHTMGGQLSYRAVLLGESCDVSATTCGERQPLASNSIESFILEHYWGYTRRNDGTVAEYRVKHPSWNFWSASSACVAPALIATYPSDFHSFLAAKPHSAFVAEGSPVTVYTYSTFRPNVCMKSAPTTESVGWVLYDGRCGFCSWLIRRCQRLLRAAMLEVAPLQSAWVREVLPFPKESLTSDIRLLTSTGTVFSGADAYLFAIKRIWWLAPLGYLLSVPGLRWLTWKIYKMINQRRFLVSRACNLSPEISNPE